MRTNELMLYKNMEYGEILKDITFLIDNYESEYYNKEHGSHETAFFNNTFQKQNDLIQCKLFRFLQRSIFYFLSITNLKQIK